MKKELADFSIIIPTYNSLELFKSAFYSVQSQINVSFILIVVDDSDLNCVSNFIKSQNFHNVKYVKNYPRLGAVKNWNYGISLSKSKYTILLHHDEFFFNKTTHLFNLKQLFDRYDVVFSNVIVKRDNIYKFHTNILLKKIFNFLINNFPFLIYYFNFIGPVSCVAFKTSCFKKFNEKLVWLVDVDWYYKLFLWNNCFFDNSSIVISNHNHKFQIQNNIDFHVSNKNDISTLWHEKTVKNFLIKLFFDFKFLVKSWL